MQTQRKVERQMPERRPKRPVAPRKLPEKKLTTDDFAELVRKRADPSRQTTVAVSGSLHFELRKASLVTGMSTKQIVESAVVEFLKTIT